MTRPVSALRPGDLVYVARHRGLFRVGEPLPTSSPAYYYVHRAGLPEGEPERIPAAMLTPCPDGPRIVPTIPTGAMLTWESQARQYTRTWHEGGLQHEVHTVMGRPIHCLLWYGQPPGVRHLGHARLHGILNYYPYDMPPYEQAGNCNVFVHPDMRGRGIGTHLVREAIARWHIDLSTQRYSAAGARLAESIIRQDRQK